MAEMLEHFGVRVTLRDGVARAGRDRTWTTSRRPTSSSARCARRSSCSVRCSPDSVARACRCPAAMQHRGPARRPARARARADGRDDPVRARVPAGRGRRAARRADHPGLPERRRHREPADGGRARARHHRDRERRARARDRRPRGLPRRDGRADPGAGSSTIEIEGVDALRARRPHRRSPIASRPARCRDRRCATQRRRVAARTPGPSTWSSSSRSSRDAGADVSMTDAGLRIRQSSGARAVRLRDAAVPGVRRPTSSRSDGACSRPRTAPASSPRTSSRAGSCTWTSSTGWAPTSGPRDTTP